MADINDEQALSYAEQFVNFFRGARYLEDVVRYVKNARKEFPDLQAKKAALDAEIATAEQASQTAKQRLIEVKAGTEPIIVALTEQRDGLEAQVNRLSRQGQTLQGHEADLRRLIQDREMQVAVLTASVASLTEEENILRLKMTNHEQRLTELRQNAAKLLEG